jgi:DNA-binding MarR family transcriptional regulator
MGLRPLEVGDYRPVSKFSISETFRADNASLSALTNSCSVHFVTEVVVMNASAFPISSGLDHYGTPPVLIAASSRPAAVRAVEAVEQAGYPVFALPIEDALQRLGMQGKASAVWIEVEKDDGAPLDRLLDRVQAEVGAGLYPAVITAPTALVDQIAARIYDPSIELLFDPTPIDRAAALSLVTAMARQNNVAVNEDVSAEPSVARLRQLSDEVSRIAATLARLSVGPTVARVERSQNHASEAAPVSLETVRQVIRARRLRARFFDEELLADPAWDMLLDLLQAEIAQHRVPVSSLCIAACVPATTALRWIKTMTDAGLFKRRADPHDGRRVFVELAPTASDAMRRYFAEVGRVAVI